jgi:serine/threonine protein kinase
LKSSNLLIDKKWRCKVSDFGISRVKKSTLAGSESTSQTTNTVIGTPAYMAPETISRNTFSEASDVYSFGVVLAELIDGNAPFSDLDLFPQQVMYGVVHENLRPSVPASCPASLKALIDDCLNAAANKRPDFEEIKKRLKRI